MNNRIKSLDIIDPCDTAGFIQMLSGLERGIDKKLAALILESHAHGLHSNGVYGDDLTNRIVQFRIALSDAGHKHEMIQRKERREWIIGILDRVLKLAKVFQGMWRGIL